MRKPKWDLHKDPISFDEAKLFAEEVVCRQIDGLKVIDSARYSYAWKDRGTTHNLQVYRNGKPEFFVSVEDRASKLEATDTEE